MNWPRYVCAILEDATGHLLLEVRPPDGRLAAGRLTCFGGERHPEEHPEQGLRRELREELGWEPGTLVQQVELWVGPKLIAWFYHGVLDQPVSQLQLEPGVQARLARPAELGDLALSPWHAAVLQAWQAGKSRVELER